MHLLCLLTYFAIRFDSSTVKGIPVRSVSSLNNISSNDSRFQNSLNCSKTQEYTASKVVLTESRIIFIESLNKSFSPSEYRTEGEKYYVCVSSTEIHKKNDIETCRTFTYEPDEFHIFDNGTVLLYGDLLEPGSYKLENGKLLACDISDDNNTNNGNGGDETEYDVGIYIGQIGSAISIVALLAHLMTFCWVPTLRNLPGYNLASLSLAFLLAYSFLLIGQIPQVLDVSCVVSGLLQQNFFLAAFFCMNVMAFDVWRTLKLATEKLIIGNNNFKKRLFLSYSIYAWGVPLIITAISAILDNVKSAPENLKPGFGKDNVCWMSNNYAKAIFFVVPAFSIVLINAVFFVLSFIIIKRNTLKCTADQYKQTVTTNYFLYARLGVMMGITWLMGVIALVAGSRVIWLINDLLNSLQGLFLFLLFTCSRKVFKHFKSQRSSEVISSDKQSTYSSKLDSQ